MSMQTPGFFADLPSIALRDPLAELLGAAQGGRLEYSFVDAVKLTGHSCPTVAGAWLATVHALRALYGEALPERGAIRVEVRGRAEEGVTGVVASVAGLLTGAAAEGGFKGIAGRFERRGLLRFGAPIARDIRFTRLDRGESVEMDLEHASPAAPDLINALRRAISPHATEPERKSFADAWQARVAAMVPRMANWQP
jgi:hypothetical protein